MLYDGGGMQVLFINFAPASGQLGRDVGGYEMSGGSGGHRPPLRLLQLRHISRAFRRLVLPPLTWAMM